MEVGKPKGMRDFAPEEMIKRNFILDTVRKVFEAYGFDPLETPAVEKWEVLSAKGAGGSEILKETYKFKDKGGRDVGLRYDLTVPLARFIAMNPNLPLPFKRYQIGRVWRYADVTKGRLREFWQADIDIIGSNNMIGDAEIIACANSALQTLGFKRFTIRINNRKILSALVKYAGVENSRIMDVFKAIDKSDKIGIDGVKNELSAKIGISHEVRDKILGFIEISGKPKEVLKKAGDMIRNFNEGKRGIEELNQLISYLNMMGVSSKELKVDLSLARGLDYYTGPIFEIVASKDMGSIAGGGRYDKMIGLFLGGKDISATGISLGIERIIEIMKDKKMVESKKTNAGVFVANVNVEVMKETIQIAQSLREKKIPTLFDLRGRKLTKQLEIVNSLGIPYTLIVGPNELKERKVTLRYMKTGEQKTVEIEKICEEIAN
jgi:histidyl-tRNA synthetase